MKILTLIINFNQDIKKSITYCSSISVIKGNNDIDLFIWDNLSKEDNYAEVCKDFGDKRVIYFGCVENKGLAHIYNYVIENYANNYDYLLLLDDDSKIDKRFFESAIKSIKQNQEIELFVPRVYDKNQMISPAKLFIIKGKYIKKKMNGIFSVGHHSMINSGMIISCNFLKRTKFCYDERMNFYWTDNFFIKKYSKQKDALFYVLDYDMQHSLSKNKNESVEKKLFRFADFKLGLIITYIDDPWYVFFICKIYLLLLSFKYAIKYRDIKFLKC